MSFLPRGYPSSALPFYSPQAPSQRHRLLPPNRKSVPCRPAGSCLRGLPERQALAGPSCLLRLVRQPPPQPPLRCLEQSAHSSDKTHLRRATLGGRRVAGAGEGHSHEGAGTHKSWYHVHSGAWLSSSSCSQPQKLSKCQVAKPPSHLPRKAPSHIYHDLSLRESSSRDPGFFRKQRIMNELMVN